MNCCLGKEKDGGGRLPWGWDRGQECSSRRGRASSDEQNIGGGGEKGGGAPIHLVPSKKLRRQDAEGKRRLCGGREEFLFLSGASPGGALYPGGKGRHWASTMRACWERESSLGVGRGGRGNRVGGKKKEKRLCGVEASRHPTLGGCPVRAARRMGRGSQKGKGGAEDGGE